MQIEDYLYQKKLHEPLAKARPTCMKAEDWTLLDRQALGAIRLSLAKNVAYNIVNEKTTYDLFKALSNMYEKPSASKVDIKFDDEVQALLLLSSLPDSWSGTVTAISGSTGSTKLKFDNICGLIHGEDICRKTSGEYSNSLLSAEDKGRGRKQDRGHKQNIVETMMTPVCCVENTIGDRIMDSSASFHATYCKEELERFKLRSDKVRLADDKTQDIVDVGDLALKTSIRHMREKGMKILASKGRILDLQKAVVGFCEPCVLGKQKKKVVAKNETNLRVKCLKSNNGGAYSSQEFIEYCAKNEIIMLKRVPKIPQQNGVAKRINRTLNERAKKGEWQGKEVSLAHLRVFGCESYVKEKDVARDKLDAKSVKCTFMGYGSDEMGYRFWDSKSHKVIRSRDVTFNGDSLYGAKAATDSSNLMKPNKKDQVVLEDSPENLKNKSIVAKHGLSSKITQSPGGSSDMSEGRSYEKDFENKASSEEGGSETQQVGRSTKESKALVSGRRLLIEMVSLEKNQTWSLLRLLVGKKTLQSKWVFRVKEEHDGRKKYKDRLVVKGFQHKQGVNYNEIFSSIVKITTIRHHMTQPEGFQSFKKEENFVCKFKKSLYGLKKAPRLCIRHGRDQEAQEIVVSRIQDEGFRFRKANSRHEHHHRDNEGYSKAIPREIHREECYSSRKESGVSQSNETHQDKISLYPKIGKRRDIIFEEYSLSKEPCRYAHHGGDNREVEALRSFNWPLR
nr:retrovirus-related Pol polyprotein from transposon TNT 1-94 [Tanacetum cinerariifolium]